VEGPGGAHGFGAPRGLPVADRRGAGGGQAAGRGPGDGAPLGGRRGDRRRRAAGGDLGRAGGDQGVEGEGAPAGGGQRDPEGGDDFLRVNAILRGARWGSLVS